MECPVCGDQCVLYGAVHEYHCRNCGWEESDGVLVDVDDESDESSVLENGDEKKNVR